MCRYLYQLSAGKMDAGLRAFLNLTPLRMRSTEDDVIQFQNPMFSVPLDTGDHMKLIKIFLDKFWLRIFSLGKH